MKPLLIFIFPILMTFSNEIDNHFSQPLVQPEALYSHRGIPLPEVYHRGIGKPMTTQDSLEYLAQVSVKFFESIRLEAYSDYSQYTNGWGTKALYPNEVIDLDEANRRFNEHFSETFSNVSEEFPNLDLSQKYATTIFAYNVSIHQIKSANITPRKLKDGEKPPFHLWVHAGGSVLEGLVKRRQYESDFWDNWRRIYEERLPIMEEIINYKIKQHAT